MEEGNSLSEHLRGIEKEVDEKYPSPSDRASTILHFLQRRDFSVWDTVCFCAEYLALVSQAYPFIHEEARRLVVKVYSAHYQTMEVEIDRESRIGDKPDINETPTGNREQSNSDRPIKESN